MITVAERIKKLESRLKEVEQAKINRKKTYEKGIQMLNAESDSLKARLYDLEHQQKKS